MKHFKGCDSNFEVTFSYFQSCYKWHNYIALNTVLKQYSNNDQQISGQFLSWPIHLYILNVSVCFLIQRCLHLALTSV